MKRLVCFLMILVFSLSLYNPAAAYPTKKQQRKIEWVSRVIHHRLSARAYGDVECDTVARFQEAKTVVGGFFMFHVGQRVRWCWNGKRITKVQWSAPLIKQSAWTFWKFNKATYHPSKTGGGGNSYRYRRIETEWQLCYLWACTYRRPWVAITVRKDGSFLTASGRGY